MAEIIDFNQAKRKINVNELKNNARKLDAGLIKPATEVMESDIVVSHSADPIKSLDDIFMITEYLVERKRYRDNMLFIVGINFGLRVSDLRVLRFGDLINDNLTFKDKFAVFERKTRNTRKRKKNRYITINQAVMEAVTLYLEHTDNVSLSDYMFKNMSSNRDVMGYGGNEPLTARSIDRILKGIAEDLNLPYHMSTHTLRKTFCYHQMAMSNNSSRKLLLLQQMLGHSTSAQTLDYIGLTDEEIGKAYEDLNLGSKEHCYLVDSRIFDYNDEVVC